MSKIDWDIINSFLERTTFFVDAHDRYEVFAEYRKANGCLHFHPVNSKDFEATLRMWYRNQTGECSIPSLQPVLQYIQDEAIFSEDLDEVSLTYLPPPFPVMRA